MEEEEGQGRSDTWDLGRRWAEVYTDADGLCSQADIAPGVGIDTGPAEVELETEEHNRSGMHAKEVEAVVVGNTSDRVMEAADIAGRPGIARIVAAAAPGRIGIAEAVEKGIEGIVGPSRELEMDGKMSNSGFV